MKLKHRIAAAAKRCGIDAEGFERAALVKACHEVEATGSITFPGGEKATVRLEVPAGITDAEKRLFAALAERDGVAAPEKLRELILSYTNSHLAP